MTALLTFIPRTASTEVVTAAILGLATVLAPPRAGEVVLAAGQGMADVLPYEGNKDRAAQTEHDRTCCAELVVAVVRATVRSADRAKTDMAAGGWICVCWFG